MMEATAAPPSYEVTVSPRRSLEHMDRAHSQAGTTHTRRMGNTVPPSLRDFYANGGAGVYSPYGDNAGDKVYEKHVAARERELESQGVLLFIVAWYVLSTVNNVVEKAVLNAADMPLGLGLSQMFGTALISYVCLVFSGKPVLKEKHKKSRGGPWEPDPEAMLMTDQSPMRVQSYEAVMRIVPIAGCVAGMRGLHNVALGIVSLKLLQTVKCTAPVLNVTMQKLMYGKSFSGQTYFSLVIISVGIILTCGTELDLSLVGVAIGVASTFMQNLQTIFGKRLLDDNPEMRVGEMELQFWTCLMSGMIYFPIWCLTEGLSPIVFSKESQPKTLTLLVGAGFFYFAQSWVALKVLAKLDGALSHTIASTFKRVVLIVFSAIWFGNPVSPLNALGICFAMGGLAYYNYTKHMNGAMLKSIKDKANSVMLPHTLPK